MSSSPSVPGDDWGAILPLLQRDAEVAAALLNLSRADADDVVGQCAMALVRSRPATCPERLDQPTASGWRFRYVWHRALRWRRHEQRSRHAGLDAVADADPHAPIPGALRECLAAEQLDRLPPELRIIVDLALGGFDRDGIAARLVLPRGLVRARMLRAAAVLRALDGLPRATALCALPAESLAALPHPLPLPYLTTLARAGWEPAELAHVFGLGLAAVRKYLQRHP